MGGRVQRRQDSAGRVREQVHPVQAQVHAQRLNVIDEPVDTEGRRVRRIGRQPNTAGVHQDQLP